MGVTALIEHPVQKHPAGKPKYKMMQNGNLLIKQNDI